MEVSKGKECVFTWAIENFSFCIQSCQNWLESPTLIARNMENSRWIILVYPRGIMDENYISVYLKHVDGNLSGQKINFEFQLIGFNESVRRDVHLCQKNVLQGFPLFLLRDAIGMNKRNRDFFLPHDTFRLRCRLWYAGTEIVEYGQCSAKTLMGVERLCLVWDLQEFSTLRADLKKTLPFTSSSACPLVSMSLFWTYKIYFTDELTVEIAIKTVVNTVCSCKISNVGIEGKTIPLIETEKYFYLGEDVQIWSLPPLFSKRHLMTRKDAYLSNDTLSLKCEFTFSTGYLAHDTLETYIGPKIFHSVGEDFHNVNCPNFVKAESMNELKNDLESLYTESINCDVNLRVETEVIPVHKAILSARSPVFRAMFSHDMKENVSGFVDILDIDLKTMRLMLAYMYSNNFKDLDGTNVQKLYIAADKYGFVSLKQRCSTYMLIRITAENACHVLAMADMNHDLDFKTSVQDFIVRNCDEVFSTCAWKSFISTHSHLAAETMHLKYLKE